MLIRLANCHGTLVENNVLLSGGSPVVTGITIESTCTDIRIGANSYNAAITTKVSDSGVGTMGVVKTASLQNSWVEFGATSTTAQYMKSIDGIVHIWGSIKGGTTANGTLLFTLPVGFRPTEIIRTVGLDDNAGAATACELSIESDGKVTINFVAGNTMLNLNATFPADNVANSVSAE